MSMTTELIRENARLRKRVALLERARKRRPDGSALSRLLQTEFAEAREQQTATSQVLRIIRSSPTDVQPVFDAIAQSARRLCDAAFCVVLRFDGQFLHFVAHHGLTAEGVEAARRAFPRAPDRRSAAGRAILSGTVEQIPDVHADPDYALGALATVITYQSNLAVPMVRDDVPIGVITVPRRQVGAFPDRQIELLETFADQAVVAIENARLYTELQARNRELTEALEQQTATSEILRVISSSPTDVQPVLDAVAESGARLCQAEDASVYRVEREFLRLAAHYGPVDHAADTVLLPIGRDLTIGRAVLDRQTVHVPDLADADDEFPRAAPLARRFGHHAVLSTPLLREGVALGAILIRRREIRPFAASQIALLQTFADQAVIAIENVRLFTELQARTAQLTRSVEELRALGEVGQAVNSTLDLETVLTTIVTRAVELSATDSGAIYEFDEAVQEFELRATHGMTPELIEAVREARVRVEEAVGRAATGRRPVQIPDIAEEPTYPARDVMLRAGFRAFLVVPLVREDRIIGLLAVRRHTPGQFLEATVNLLQTFASQSVLAIQNARLFQEIEDKSRQLEAASRHKSEFLANMSHELRTPLNAILGFSEVLTERMFGDLNPKQEEYLRDIHTSGQHLLSLINDILDLSKVEAGRLELELASFNLPMAVGNAMTLVRERATRHGITLDQAIDDRVGDIVADERKVKQILLNLLSNAVKFTPAGGRIGVTATATDEAITISVSDTGIGIAPEDRATIFEEFRQVGRDDARKQEGTGLGLTLAKKFVELHGGQIGIQSQVGQGSTFTFTLPLRPERATARE
jgi:signal transduction histidine kinase